MLSYMLSYILSYKYTYIHYITLPYLTLHYIHYIHYIHNITNKTTQNTTHHNIRWHDITYTHYMPTYFLIFLNFLTSVLSFLLALLYFTLLCLLPCFLASLLPCFLASLLPCCLPSVLTYLLAYLLTFLHRLTHIDVHWHALAFINIHWHALTFMNIHWHTLTYIRTDTQILYKSLLIFSLCPYWNVLHGCTCWRSVSGLIGLQAFHHLDPRPGVWCLEIPGSSTKWAPTRLINHWRVGWSSKCRNLWDLVRMRVSTVLQGAGRVSKKWAFCGDVLLNVSYLSLWEHSRVINVNSVDRF
jgi:hypothetical protein